MDQTYNQGTLNRDFKFPPVNPLAACDISLIATTTWASPLSIEAQMEPETQVTDGTTLFIFSEGFLLDVLSPNQATEPFGTGGHNE